MNTNSLVKLAVLTKIKKSSQSFVINGVEQKIENESFVLACPKCGRVIIEFPQELNDLSKVINEIKMHKNELLNISKYCSSCGTKISYDYDIIENNLENVEKSSCSQEKVV